MDSKIIVIAIGGNSLIEDNKNVTVSTQYAAAAKTAHHIAKLVKAGHSVVIAHGNGPQVGYILRRSEYSTKILHPVPLDSCVADTQGAIGYQLQMALDNEFTKMGLKASVATIVTQVEVDPDDPSFKNPSKPIGSFMDEETAMMHKKESGWDVVEDAGRGWRRVVPSPKPKSIIELDAVDKLINAGVIVIAGGGGGIPVVRNADGTLSGKEAVIDKDLAAALLAKHLKADYFVISTAVEKVAINFNKPNQMDLGQINLTEARRYMAEGHFAPGSMLPKVQAMVDFVETTGNVGLITDPAHIYDAIYKDAGTKIVK